MFANEQDHLRRMADDEPVHSQPTSAGLGRLNARAPWSDEDLQQLADLVRTETPMRIIALRMGRSFEAVRGRAYQAGLLGMRARLSVKWAPD